MIEESYYSPQDELLKTTIHEYSAFHLLKTIDPEGLVTTYSYDRAGRLEWTRKANRATQCLYDSQGRLYEEREWFGENPSDYCSTITHYDLLDRVVETRIKDSSKNLLNRVCYAYDEDGNCIFEQASEQITRTDYNAFGEEEIISPEGTSSIGNPWRFAGKRADSDTNLISFGLRDYDASLGRLCHTRPGRI